MDELSQNELWSTMLQMSCHSMPEQVMGSLPMELWWTMSWMGCLLCMLWLYKSSSVYSTVEELVVAVQFSLSIVSNSY